ncbi:Outer membrane protein OprM [Paraburkholderia nemoris]|uniref:Outer membrane protein OprM n=2 Tax=Paraburkholderia nemoris TaxID=2793076 RepID=A0ABM8QUP3_9BURK|nr:efflux transporter outer membrane subunit [Paraburkholderia aspalathi]MBK3809431.1 efflux transporter outer membrane subunit [Paraburkholderia aspalathi]CAE6700226.1 Outer membrane protein OprM [Paraburkholderia nemoris]CAE6716456.1 Outer membrane protein OprM [Paraburkholderia nemoris]CAE6719032.1 Outer membrane protein OprM [Paraburkholderia nemoris]
MMRLKLSACMVAFAVAMLTGCTLDPHYERPAAPVAVAYPKGEAYESTSAAAASTAASGTASGAATPATTTTAPPLAADVAWRSFFRDERLQRLIQIALDNNRDLRVAALNVAEYEAQYRITRAALAPSISASGSLTRERTSGVTSSSSDVSVGTTSWEIDFFGRLRSLERQALENYLATDASRQSTQISLIATVATDYLTLLSDERLLQITEDTVKADQSTYDVTKRIQQLGNSSMLDVQQAQNSLASAKASLASYRRAVAQDRNNLVAVLGAPIPDDLPPAREFDDESMFADIGAGVPSLLLTRRPDIVQAEHALKAANANIGAARAAFFPKIELTASAGTSSSTLSSLFKAGTGAWAFAPSVSVPIFDYGSNKASLDVAKIEKQIEVADYESAIQTAFKEVSNALTARATYVDQVEADRDYVTSAQRYYTLAQARYKAGTDSFLTFLDAQRTLYTAQQQLASDSLSRQANLVTLYKVLGGGWEGS